MIWRVCVDKHPVGGIAKPFLTAIGNKIEYAAPSYFAINQAIGMMSMMESESSLDPRNRC